MLKYRCVLTDPNITETPDKPAKPTQAFFAGYQYAEQWANKMLESAGPGSFVIIHAIEETQLTRVDKPAPKSPTSGPQAVPDAKP